MRPLSLLIAVVLASALLPRRATAYTCGCFVNRYDNNYLGLMCTAFYVPSSIIGYGPPNNTWFSTDCSTCSVEWQKCLTHGEQEAIENGTLAKPTVQAMGAATKQHNADGAPKQHQPQLSTTIIAPGTANHVTK